MSNEEESGFGAPLDVEESSQSLETSLPPPSPEVSSSSSSSSAASSFLEVKGKKLSSLIAILSQKGSVKVDSKETQSVKDECPFFILTLLFGPLTDHEQLVNELDGINGIDTIERLFLKATDVLSKSTKKVFGELDTPEENPIAPHNEEYGSELEYLQSGDEVLERKSIIPMLLDDMSPCRSNDRRMISAQMLVLVHTIRAIVHSQFDDVSKVIGDDKKILTRVRKSQTWKNVEKDTLTFENNAVLGKFDELLKGGFIYEIFANICSPTVRLSLFTDSLITAEYHVIRCAMDAVNFKRLRICVLSRQYIVSIWLPYMRLYYPRLFKDHREDAPELTWNELVIYLPDQEHLVEPIDHFAMVEFLKEFILNEFDEDFIKRIKNVFAPDEYQTLSEDLFEKHSVRPKRRCSSGKNYKEKRTNKTKKAREQ
jgi:hypothetical protein